MFFEIIDELRESWPALKLNYNKMPTTDQHRGLENGSIDIAIGLKLPHWEEAGFKIKKLKKEETLIVVSNPHDPYLLNNPYYHSIPFESEYSDSYVCVTNPNNTNPVIKLFMDLIEDGEL